KVILWIIHFLTHFLSRYFRCKLEIVGHSRYRINLNPKARNVKGMNNIFRNDVETNGFINRDHNIGALDIVPSTLIREIYTVGVHRSSQLIVTVTALAVITSIPHLPVDLLCYDLDSIPGFLQFFW